MHRKYFQSFALFFCALALLGGGLLPAFAGEANQTPSVSEVKRSLKVVATLEIHKAIAEDLGGGDIDVEALIPCGQSPCSFDPIPSDRRKIEACDLWIGSKQFFEERVAPNLSTQRYICLHEKNPHEMMHPEHLKRGVSQIAQALKELIPEKSAVIDRRRDEYINKIDLTSAKVKEILASGSKKQLLALHPTYRGYCNAFNLDHIALENCHGGMTIKTVERVKEVLRVKSLATKGDCCVSLLVDTSVNKEKADRIANELGVQLHVLDPYAPDVLSTYLKLAEAAW